MNDLVVCTGAKCITHSFECANVAHVALPVSSVRLGNRCSLALSSPEQQTSVATDELASEAEVVGQPHERVKRVVWKAGVLASGEHPKLVHVVLVTGRVRADVIANKP